MTRQQLCSLLVVFGAMLFGVRFAHADPISPQNPYKSYNLSGINYGSMEWERTHRQQTAVVRPQTTVRYYVPASTPRQRLRRR